ncbi:MAG TPA: hypothetical protein PKH77_03545, partial [Anaerolineae bacterium]|nr:hypothetical protein [Anaerolineae bacterium]
KGGAKLAKFFLFASLRLCVKQILIFRGGIDGKYGCFKIAKKAFRNSKILFRSDEVDALSVCCAFFHYVCDFHALPDVARRRDGVSGIVGLHRQMGVGGAG